MGKQSSGSLGDEKRKKVLWPSREEECFPASVAARGSDALSTLRVSPSVSSWKCSSLLSVLSHSLTLSPSLSHFPLPSPLSLSSPLCPSPLLSTPLSLLLSPSPLLLSPSPPLSLSSPLSPLWHPDLISKP